MREPRRFVVDREPPYDDIMLELSALTSTERKLHASEDRRRVWLLEQLEHYTAKDRGVQELLEKRAVLMRRQDPPELDL